MPWRDDKFQLQQQAHESQFLATVRVISPSCSRSWAAPRSQWRRGKGWGNMLPRHLSSRSGGQRCAEEHACGWELLPSRATHPAALRLQLSILLGARLRKRTEACLVGCSVQTGALSSVFPSCPRVPCWLLRLRACVPRRDHYKWGWLPSRAHSGCGFQSLFTASVLCWKLGNAPTIGTFSRSLWNIKPVACL